MIRFLILMAVESSNAWNILKTWNICCPRLSLALLSYLTVVIKIVLCPLLVVVSVQMSARFLTAVLDPLPPQKEEPEISFRLVDS